MGVDTAWERFRWTIGRTARNFHYPHWWRVAVWNRIRNGMLHAHFRLMAPDGVDIMSEDWDNLLILDGCRYDMFADLNTLPGRLEPRYSKATATPEFLERNLAEEQHHDTVYVTANPMYRRDEVAIDCSEKFFEIVDVWESEWDGDVNTVRPGVMTEAVSDTHDRFPDKRILAHFVQPHHPFIGELGSELDDAGMRGDRSNTADSGKKIWDRLRDGEVSIDPVEAAYRENLELLFPHLQPLVSALTGRTVVTSDHGNLLGEPLRPFPFREFGHPSDVYAEGLLRVPWLMIEGDSRKEVVAGSPARDDERAMTDDAASRLEDLGYLQN